MSIKVQNLLSKYVTLQTNIVTSWRKKKKNLSFPNRLKNSSIPWLIISRRFYLDVYYQIKERKSYCFRRNKENNEVDPISSIMRRSKITKKSNDTRNACLHSLNTYIIHKCLDVFFISKKIKDENKISESEKSKEWKRQHNEWWNNKVRVENDRPTSNGRASAKNKNMI